MSQSVLDPFIWPIMATTKEKTMKNLIVRLTERLWNRRISSILGRAYEKRIIDSKVLHTLCAQFDPTQKVSRW